MKLIVNCDKELLELKKDVTVLRQLELLKTFHSDILYVGSGWNSNYLDLRRAIKDYKPDVIFYAADLDYNDVRLPITTDSVKIACMQDYWDSLEDRLSILKFQKINKVITKNNIGLDVYSNRIENFQYLVNSSGYDDNIFQNLHIEKEYDILISGALHPDKYKTRIRLSAIANTISDKYRVYRRLHPGYCYDKIDIKNEQFQYNIDINKSKIAIGGTGMNSHMQKIWEISATSAICVTDLNKDELNYNLIKQHVHEIDMKKSDVEIQGELIYLLQNYDIIKSNILSYNKIVESYANLKSRTLHLLDCIKLLYLKR